MVYSEAEIRERMSKYGTVYFPDDILDEVDDLVGIEENKAMLNDFFKTLESYEEYAEKLRSVRMTPSITCLLYGPPGTGKTSITRALAKNYEVPMCVVESDRLVSPLLGDTLKNMRNVVELASDIAKENKVFLLFFDELDAIASERANEVGEIKRGVISFLQILDKIDYEGIPLAIFAATNHQNQLDSAVWRRFTFHAYFGFPDFEVRKEIALKYLKRLEDASIQVEGAIYNNLNQEEKLLLKEYSRMKQKSIGELSKNAFEDKYAKQSSKRDIGLLSLTRGYTGADLQRGVRVALFKAIQKGLLTFEDLYNALQFVGGTRIHVDQQAELSGSDPEKLKPSSAKKTSKKNNRKPLEI